MTQKETQREIPMSRRVPAVRASGDSVRPFRANVPEAELIELRRRTASTRWPTRELVGDRSQGVQLPALRELARYWSTESDWRK